MVGARSVDRQTGRISPMAPVNGVHWLGYETSDSRRPSDGCWTLCYMSYRGDLSGTRMMCRAALMSSVEC